MNRKHHSAVGRGDTRHPGRGGSTCRLGALVCVRLCACGEGVVEEGWKATVTRVKIYTSSEKIAEVEVHRVVDKTGGRGGNTE